MNRSELEKTAQAKNVKKECPPYYEQAIRIALIPDLHVDICWSDDGDIKWFAIISSDNNGDIEKGFWLDAKKTVEQAVDLCKIMGWPYTIIDKRPAN